ncbi:hypothetical protein ARC78_03440 [Stenotrophomonas pictorum JCM 9942]|jgi:hypothetical protein|uniref:Uncharacterized protein n=1 Tax=Stenotrophomonas pictorum JCM 9942 TaxID=1236960 RepID=A0A0R0AII6_9GAMM|nr:hypothetical protein [Stenotrophomonas pictorum]KRG44876.1 hypothetical protein ARC78_03440 [Stenotrophomonas pictorum JCM 9942]
MKNSFYLMLALLAAPALAGEPAVTSGKPPLLPLKQDGGTWDAGHVQGIAVDRQGGFIYYSFTNLLAKFDFEGKLVGTLAGWTGHLGDLDLNPADGRIYGSLEYKADQAFYIAIIDGQGINRVGMDAAEGEVFRTVHLPEVVDDYTADVDGDGRFDGDDGRYSGNEAQSPDHRYGCSGIDGVAFGPRFGASEGPLYLTVAYGIYGNTARTDNDHQVLLQYDIRDWARHAQPLIEARPHRQGPAEVDGKYFVYTGNTTYGVQNLTYDAASQRWFMGVYRGRKAAFPNYQLFAVDGRAAPVLGDLVGVPAADGKGWEQGLRLALAADGQRDPATGIRGWNQKADVGLQSLGGGLFYSVRNSGAKGAQQAELTLMRWTGDTSQPLMPVLTEPPGQ